MVKPIKLKINLRFCFLLLFLTFLVRCFPPTHYIKTAIFAQEPYPTNTPAPSLPPFYFDDKGCAWELVFDRSKQEYVYQKIDPDCPGRYEDFLNRIEFEAKCWPTVGWEYGFDEAMIKESSYKLELIDRSNYIYRISNDYGFTTIDFNGLFRCNCNHDDQAGLEIKTSCRQLVSEGLNLGYEIERDFSVKFVNGNGFFTKEEQTLNEGALGLLSWAVNANLLSSAFKKKPLYIFHSQYSGCPGGKVYQQNNDKIVIGSSKSATKCWNPVFGSFDHQTVVVHELGHLKDPTWFINWMSPATEFLNGIFVDGYLWRYQGNGSWSFLRNGRKINPQEYWLNEYSASSPFENFAELFVSYIFIPGKLLANQPNTYAYLKKSIFAGYEYSGVASENEKIDKFTAQSDLDSIMETETAILGTSFVLGVTSQERDFSLIKIGDSSERVIELVGDPDETFWEGNLETFSFNHPSSIASDQIVFENDQVVLIDVNNSGVATLGDYVNQYGSPSRMTPSLFGENSIKYVWPQKGIAIITLSNADNVRSARKIIFSPQTLEQYLARWDAGLPSENFSGLKPKENSPFDINLDFQIDNDDLWLLLYQIGKTPSAPEADLNKDKITNSLDFSEWLKNR